MIVELTVPKETSEVMDQLAELTGRKGDMAKLIQDALRVYEWVLIRQARGYSILAMPANTQGESLLMDQMMSADNAARMRDWLKDTGSSAVQRWLDKKDSVT